MDGRGSWRDNVFIERFWWSLKYENVYLHAYEEVRQARQGIGSYIEYYNRERQHSSIGKLTPEQAYERNDSAAASPAPPSAGVASGSAALASW